MVLDEIGEGLSLRDKLSKCTRFVRRIKKAIQTERQQVARNQKSNPFKKDGGTGKVKLFKVNKVIFIVARSLCVDREFMERIKGHDVERVPLFAEESMKDLFRRILKGRRVFCRDPVSRIDAARCILKRVYGVQFQQLMV